CSSGFYGIALSPDGSRLYGGGYSGDLCVIDTATGTVAATVPVGTYGPCNGPGQAMALSPDGSQLYIAGCGNEPGLTAVDTATDAATGVLPSGGDYVSVVVGEVPDAAPSVTADPIDQTVAPGAGVRFSAAATGTPAPSVAWQVRTGAGGSWSPVAGATSDTLTLSDVAESDSANQYRAQFSNFLGTATTTPATLTVGIPTTTTVSSSPDPSLYGQSVTFSADVSPSAGTGTVAFEVDGSAVAGCESEPLQPAHGGGYAASCTTASLAVGTHPVGASYSGAAPYFPSSGAVSGGQVVHRAPSSISATPALASTSPFGLDLFSLSATLSSEVTKAGLSGQSVVFSAGSSVLCRAVTDAQGTATCDAAADPADVLAILGAGGYRVAFAGSTDFLPSSTSAPLVEP
ncbi:MAG: Ig-like domain repeat protein, partial [Acidimicrobiales bacterium]